MRASLLALALAAGGALGADLPAERGAPPSPDGVARIAAAAGPWVLFDGATLVDGEWFIDGRVWLWDRRDGAVRLLTRAEDFGPAFFAEGALLLPERGEALVLVNRDDDPSNLALVPLDGGPARTVTDARSLGLDEIRAEHVVLVGEGDELAFTALRWVADPEAPHGAELRAGVYEIPLARLLEAGSAPQDHLVRLHEGAIGAGPLPTPLRADAEGAAGAAGQERSGRASVAAELGAVLAGRE